MDCDLDGDSDLLEMHLAGEYNIYVVSRDAKKDRSCQIHDGAASCHIVVVIEREYVESSALKSRVLIATQIPGGALTHSQSESANVQQRQHLGPFRVFIHTYCFTPRYRYAPTTTIAIGLPW
jgi:hypothetical protein